MVTVCPVSIQVYCIYITKRDISYYLRRNGVIGMNKKMLGKQIQKYRKEAGFSQEYFAEQLNLSSIFISHIERGEKCPSLDTLIKISNLLRVPIDLLIGPELYSSIGAKSVYINEKLQMLSYNKQQRILAFLEAIIEIELKYNDFTTDDKVKL